MFFFFFLGGTRRVVLLLPDGNLMMTEVDQEQYDALDLGKWKTENFLVFKNDVKNSVGKYFFQEDVKFE